MQHPGSPAMRARQYSVSSANRRSWISKRCWGVRFLPFQRTSYNRSVSVVVLPSRFSHSQLYSLMSKGLSNVTPASFFSFGRRSNASLPGRRITPKNSFLYPSFGSLAFLISCFYLFFINLSLDAFIENISLQIYKKFGKILFWRCWIDFIRLKTL